MAYLDDSGNPILQKTNVYLDTNGNPILTTQAVVDSAHASPIRVPANANVLQAPKGFKRYAQQRSGNNDPIDVAGIMEDVITAAFPRTSREANAGFLRRVAAGSLDAASLPGRVVSSAFAAPGNSESTFGDAMRAADAPEGLGGAESFMHSVVRDPLNITLGASGIVRGGTAAAKLAAKMPTVAKALSRVAPLLETGERLVTPAENAGRLKNATKLVARGARDVSLPVGVVNSANEFASGRDDYGNAALQAAATAPLPLVGAGARKALAKVGGIKNPFYKSASEALADPDITMMPTSVLQPKTVSEGVVRLLDHAKSMVDPQALSKALSKAWLRSQVKTAPKAFKGKELADFEAAMAYPNAMRQVTSYGDILGGVTGMAKRGLKNIDDLNRATWNPAFAAQDDAASKYNSVIDQARELSGFSNPEFAEYLKRVLGDEGIQYAEPMRGISTQAVRDRAFQLALDDAMSGYAEKSNIDLYPQIEEQWRRYAADPSATYVSGSVRDFPTVDYIPLTRAHAQKSLQQQIAYNQGVPDVNSPTRRVAAEYIGRAHNEVLDALKQELLSQSTRQKPMPTPVIDLSGILRTLKTDPELMSGFIDQPATELSVRRIAHPGSSPSTVARTFPETQKSWAGTAPSNEEVAKAALEDPVNKLLLEDATDIAGDRVETSVAERLEHPEMRQALQDEVESRLAEDKQIWRRREAEARAKGQPPVAPRRPSLVQSNRTRYLNEATKAAEEEARKNIPSAAEVVDQILNDFRNSRIPAWNKLYGEHAKTSAEMANRIAEARAADAKMAPWLKLEAPLERAYGRAGNRSPIIESPLSTVAAGALGAGLGVGSDWMYDKKLDHAGRSAILGALAGITAQRGATTPAGPRALYDLGSVLTPVFKAAEPSLSTAPKTAAVDLSSWIVGDLIDWAERLRTRKYNDAPVDSTSEGRLAEKKGDRK